MSVLKLHLNFLFKSTYF